MNLELKKLVSFWYFNEQHPYLESRIINLGYQVGEMEDDDGGAFIIQSGDINGNSFIKWTDAELRAIA